MRNQPPDPTRPKPRPRRLAAGFAAILAGSAIAAACSSSTHGAASQPAVATTSSPTTLAHTPDSAMDHGGGSPAQQPIELSISTDLARARTATARYATDLDTAKAAGYRIITPMMTDMGYHFMNPAVQGFDIEKPPILVYERSGDAWQLGALEWVFPKKPDTPPIDGATYGTFAAACHYDDGTFVPSATESACARTSPETGSSFVFWHPDLVTMHVWLWYPNPAGLFSSTNPLVAPFDEPAHAKPSKGTVRLEHWQETHGA